MAGKELATSVVSLPPRRALNGKEQQQKRND
jgi:hypothetical protein